MEATRQLTVGENTESQAAARTTHNAENEDLPHTDFEVEELLNSLDSLFVIRDDLPPIVLSWFEIEELLNDENSESQPAAHITQNAENEDLTQNAENEDLPPADFSFWFEVEEHQTYYDRVIAPAKEALDAFLDWLDSSGVLNGGVSATRDHWGIFEVPHRNDSLCSLQLDSIVMTVSSVDNQSNSGLEFPTTTSAMPSPEFLDNMFTALFTSIRQHQNDNVQRYGAMVLVEKSRTSVPTGPGVHSQQGSMALLN